MSFENVLVTPEEDQAQSAQPAAATPTSAPAAAPAPATTPAPAPTGPAQAAQPGGQPAAQPGGQPAQPAGNTPAAPAASAAAPNPAQPHQGVLGEIFQTLAGGKKKEWQQTPNGPVATERPLKPGEMAQGILAAAITGLAAGYDPKNRGKGPAMSSAFSAGFKGEEEQRDKQAEQKEQEAQKQFSNQNLSDEMVLRKQKAATDQQKAVQDMQRDAAEIQAIQQRAAEGKTLFDEGQKDRIINQQANFDAKKAAGWTEIPHPTSPGQDFGFADMKEAQEFANKYGAHLVNPGEFNTAPVYNPATGLWVPMEQPKGYDDLKQVRFAKMENGQPVKDPKNPGKYLSDGSKDSSGRPLVPTEMTNKDYESWLTNDTKMRMDKATATEKYAMATELIEKQKKDKLLAQADSRYADAGGDPFAVNIKDGTWIMTDGDRSRLRNAAVSNLAGMEKAREAAQKELENAGSKEEQAAARDTFAKADQAWNYYSTQLAALNGRISKSGSLANAYIKNFSDENGYDGQKALDTFDQAVKRGDYKTAGMTQEEFTKTRNYLVSAQSKAEAAKNNTPPAAATSTDPMADPRLRSAIELLKGTPENQVYGHVDDAVNKGKLTADQGDQLKKHFAGVENLPPRLTAIVNMQTGKRLNVSSSDLRQWVDHGYTVIGQGTKAEPTPKVSTDVERIIK